MPQYIKSHSNYVLKSKHQTLADGSTIFERDITTIGGLNQFAPGQKPIYRSNNFIITVRDDGGISNQYNRKKWTENKVSGNIWTATALKSIVSNDEDDDDTKIVLKQDYYDFRDFCYYGSLSEMFRASITDIIARFPGELYGTDKNVYYTKTETVDGSIIEDRPVLGSNSLKYIVNPFGIDMHSAKVPEDATNPLKYFANGGYSAYTIDGTAISSWKSEYYYSEKVGKNNYIRYTASTDSTTVSSASSTTYYPCKGDKVAQITLNGNVSISAYLGDDDVVYYLSSNFVGKHITPDKPYLDSFYNECDNFQKLILNKNTTPKYKAVFSVIEETDEGYTRKFEEFIFPTSDGGYNIDASSYGFNTYTTRLSQIGEFYDELFTDNLYRSMTHEAIKNFDWTYTREYVEGDEEEYVLGGQKVQKALRVFAREFDEILSYINNIKNLNRVTYDERGNLPDYFLTDTVENEGWNVELVTPFDVSGYTSQSGKLASDCATIELHFVEASGDVKPYTKDFLGDDKNGYFMSCCDSGSETCEYKYYDDNGQKQWKYRKSYPTSGEELTRMDSCAAFPILRNRIKSYTDERVYSYHDVNNEFLRRLKLNSRAIWRHKGTLEGIDMILGIFGLRNKTWVETKKEESYYVDKNGNTHPESGTCYDKNYDYEITEYIAKTNTISDCWDEPHQMYHMDWINSTKTITYDYRSVSNYNRDGSDTTYLPYQGLPVKYEENNNSTRTLYPNFEKYEQYDGNPYFQMNGGWEDKAFRYNYNNTGNKYYPFQFNVDDDIVFTKNKELFKETVRNIRRFDTLQEMLSVPSYEISNGQIVYVTKIKSDIAVLAGVVYDIKRDNFCTGSITPPSGIGGYIELIKANGVVRAGYDYYYDEVIRVYDRYGAIKSININEIPNGQPINCYIVNGTIQCTGENDINNCSDLFSIVDPNAANYTNYFRIGDFSQCNKLYNLAKGIDGWKRLSIGDADYKKLDTIINDNKGNNPHNGMMTYDNGKEYFEYYKHLFKYAYENDMFDERCYNDYTSYRDSTISKSGFTFSMTNNDFGVSDYYWPSSENDCYKSKIDNYTNSRKDVLSNTDVNTKVIKITFYLHNGLFGDGKGECEMKYIDDVVMNYLTQMIPSTAILQIRYKK